FRQQCPSSSRAPFRWMGGAGKTARAFNSSLRRGLPEHPQWPRVAIEVRYLTMETTMPRGDKSSYSSKQKRQAEHIAEGYERRGGGKEEAERGAWATVNKMTGGGKKTGSGVGKKTNKAPAKKGGRRGGSASASRSAAARSASARKAARTRKRRASSK